MHVLVEVRTTVVSFLCFSLMFTILCEISGNMHVLVEVRTTVVSFLCFSLMFTILCEISI